MKQANLQVLIRESPLLAKAVLEEVERRKTATNLSDYQFPHQARFINSKARFLAGFCTRRAGKSYGVGIKLYNAALQTPGVSCVYIALTRDSAKRIMLKDVLMDINRKHLLDAKFNYTELSVTLQNGSIIYLLGMDSDKREMDKVLGQKFKLAVIDEAGSFRQDLREICYSKLKPACADLNGQIVIIGTPQNVTKGLFYDVVWGKTEPGWEVHKWSAFDNPFMAAQWEKEIRELAEVNPRIADTPWFKQNYLGLYVVDVDALCYRFNPDINLVAEKDIPELEHYVLGVDLGYTDASAFSLMGYRSDSKNLYIVKTVKESELIISEVAEKIQYFMKRYNPYKIIVDNASKQAVEELKQRFLLPLTPADKTGKANFIEIMNNDFVCGNILISESCQPLIEEYQNLIWDDLASKRQEHPNCENHLCDASLYAWRFCYQFVSTLRKAPLTEEQVVDSWEDKMISQLTSEGDGEWWEKY